MDLVSSGPLRTAQLRWLLANGAPALTVVCKATFSLRPGESPLASQQDEPNEDDTYWDDDSARSLSASTDLVPFKARADVLLVGSAYAASPVRSLVARLCVGPLDKSIEVCADRAFGADGALREGMPWGRMRLRYERAAGGAETPNPVGMRFDVQDARGNTVLPNLQPVGAMLGRRGDGFGPIGFGPIAPAWRERSAKVHRATPGWSPYGWASRPLPEGFDASFFNAAPPDQQLESLRPDEPIVLEHLHAEHARLTTRLADVLPRATVERPGAPPQPLALVCDTLSIDTDRGLCHLVWRGTVRLSHPAEAGRIVVSTGEEESAPSWNNPSPPQQPDGDRTIAPMMGGGGMAAFMPFARGRAEGPPAPPLPRAAAPGSALPFQRGGGGYGPPAGAPHPQQIPPPPPSTASIQTAPPPPPPGPPGGKPAFSLSSSAHEGTAIVEIPTGAHAAVGGPPPPSGPRPAMPSPATPPSPGLAPPGLAPPGLAPSGLAPSGLAPPGLAPPGLASLPMPMPGPVPPPPAPPPPVAPIETSPWAASGGAPDPARGSYGERMQKEPQAPPTPTDERRLRGEPEHLGGLTRSGETAVPSFLAAAAVAGVVAASNAAADPPPPVPSRGAGRAPLQRIASEAVDLVWFDAESVGRIRRRPPWRVLLSDLENAPEADSEEGALGNTPEEIEDRRDVLHVLVHGAAVDQYGISEALEQGVRADGKVINPLVLTTGQLAFSFDEMEMLKATLSAAMPFAQGDEALTAATTAAKEFLSTPGLIATGAVIESLTLRLREAFLRVKRPVANDYLTVQGERALLEKRHYQKREVFSKTHLRGLFFPIGAQDPIPAYLPEEVSKKLPLYQRFSARMIVEVHRTADQNEVHPAALRALALGRTLGARA